MISGFMWKCFIISWGLCSRIFKECHPFERWRKGNRMQLPLNALEPILMAALQEDIGPGDLTSAATIAPEATARFAFVARHPMVVSGQVVLPLLFGLVDPRIEIELLVEDGEEVEAGAILTIVEGPARALLAGERTALNFLQRMSGIATLTARYVDAVEGTGARITDTRKTAPGLRLLDKYAVSCGGGQNHRIGLYDGVLIKDNHLAICGSVTLAVERARAETPLLTKIEVECDTLAQVREAIAAGADMVLLDNMELAELREAIALARAGHVMTEASGGVSLETVRAIAETGADYISIGRLTHSVEAADIGLDAA
jgi:nicotinate-nucleotide pyrophosphorylase (carboxylating)